MNRRIKMLTLALVIVLLISSMSVLLTSCNTPKYYASLEQAYADGKISRQDLMSIAYYFSRSHNEFEEDFVPTPKNPEDLDDKTKEKLVKIFVDKGGVHGEDLSNWEGRLDFVHYLGTYNNIIVCVIEYPAAFDDTRTIHIDDIILKSKCDWEIMAIELW